MDSTYFSGLDGISGHDLAHPLSPTGDAVSAKKANALSTKIATVLSSSYADSELRDALRQLEVRQTENSDEIRRSLKLDAQKEVIDANAQVVNDFGQVAEQLKRVGTLIDTLNKACDDIRQHVLAAKQDSAPVLEEASTLLVRKEESEARQHLLDAFSKHFIVSDADLRTLTSTAEPLDERFFVILARVKQIHRDCEILLGHENQRLGLELMEQTTRDLDAGFKKLYAWIQREFKGLDLEDPNISGSIRRALRVLSERPTLFQNCLDFFAQARESTLSEAFQAALTGGVSGQAIEFSTHDPLRYVGDMLAWVHSATVSEKEALEGLFISDADEISKGLSSGRSNEPWARVRQPSTTADIDTDGVEETVFDGKKALSDLVSRNLNGVCQKVNNRIELAANNIDDATLVYKIYNLLTFYQDIFAKLVGTEASIGKTITQLESSVSDHFEKMIEEEIAAAVAETTTPNSDLSPPSYMHTAVLQFTDIARARGPQMTDNELERLFSALISGVIGACAELATQIADAHQGAIYKINYLSVVQSSLRNVVSIVSYAQVPLNKVSAELRALRDRMVESLVTTLLEDSGVSTVLQETDVRKDVEAKRKWLLENLEDAADKLDDFLASGLMDAQESQKHLENKGLAKEVVGEAVERFCSDFDELESMIQLVDEERPQINGENAEEEVVLLRDVYPRTAAEVRTLLS